MEDFLYSLTSGEWAGQLNAKSVLEAVLTAAAIGLIISLVYLFTHKKEGYSQAFCVSLILLAPIVAMVILVIGLSATMLPRHSHLPVHSHLFVSEAHPATQRI